MKYVFLMIIAGILSCEAVGKSNSIPKIEYVQLNMGGVQRSIALSHKGNKWIGYYADTVGNKQVPSKRIAIESDGITRNADGSLHSFTGKIKGYDDDQQNSLNTSYILNKDGVENGAGEYRADDGTWWKGTYKNGKKDGIWKHVAVSGKLIETKQYQAKANTEGNKVAGTEKLSDIYGSWVCGLEKLKISSETVTLRDIYGIENNLFNVDDINLTKSSGRVKATAHFEFVRSFSVTTYSMDVQWAGNDPDDIYVDFYGGGFGAGKFYHRQ
jgi:hypothetical protein